MARSNPPTEQSYLVFKKLSRYYLLALSAIAIVVLVSHSFIQRHLDKQLNDSRVVNVAGRQRMLSQKIAKQALHIQTLSPSDSLNGEGLRV